MISRSFLLLMCLLFLAPPAGAADEGWRPFERSFDQHRLQALTEAAQDLQQSEQRGDKQGQLKALRKLTYGDQAAGPESSAVAAQIDRGIALSRELRDDESHAWLLFAKARNAAKAKRSAEAETLLKQATTIAERDKLDPLQAHILVWRTQSLEEARAADAQAGLLKAHDLFGAAQDKRGMALALHTLAHAHLNDAGATDVTDQSKQANQESMGKVVELETQVLSLADPAVDWDQASAAHWYLGMAYSRLANHQQAKANLAKALSIATDHQDQTRMGMVEHHLANAYTLEKRHTDALAHFDIALRLLSQNDRAAAFKTTYERAATLAQLGRKQESRDGLSQAQAQLNWMEQQGHLRTVRDYYSSSAQTYALLEDHEPAYRQIVKFWEREQGAGATSSRKVADELKVKFDVKLKEAENALLRSQQVEAETKRIALMLALALSLLMLGAVWLYLRRRAAAAKIDAERHKALAAAEAAANDAKRSFLANMSHELRSPLNVVLGFTQLLMRRSELPQDAQQDLSIVYNSGQHLYTLINQVLDLSKIEAGRITLNEISFDLYALLDELTGMFTITASQKDLHLLIENDPNVPQYLRADALKLRQVLINLLNNAIKFTSSGSVVLRVTPSEGGANMLNFAVSDTGPGIAPDELGKLGNAFVQAQAGRVAKEGTGLGLAISSSFVQLMGGGQLKFSSELGEGTTIAFDLPVQVAQAAAPTAARQPRVIGLASGQPRYRILVTDDRTESRQLLTRLLTPLGFEVREADNGESALVVWEEWSPHLIWMDMRMPIMDGREATKWIKATEKGKATVIIALTASGFDEQREEILADGCDDFMRKPFRESELLEMMHKHLGVQFIYEGSADATATQPDNAPIAPPPTGLPAELREQLQRAVKELNVDAVETVIDQIREYDEALANTLAQMAYRYEYDKIRDWVEGNATM